jgi:hypothetical protein
VQKIKWYRLTTGDGDVVETYGMNVPGGVVLRSSDERGVSTCFVPNVVLVEKEGEVGFESIMMEFGFMVGFGPLRVGGPQGGALGGCEK